MRNKLALFLFAGTFLFTGASASAQSASPAQGAPASGGIASDQDIQLLRQDIRSKKKQLIAANLSLTDAEATKFWPIYDQYTAELVKINDEKYAVIKDYADNWGTMTDAKALDLTRRYLDVDAKVTALRTKYVPIINKVLPGTKTATFFQMEHRIGMMIDLQLSSQIPLVQDQK